MGLDIEHLLSDDYREPEESGGRETFLVSVLSHIGVIMLLVMHPEILFSPPKPVIIVQPQEDVTMVYSPPPKLTAPPLPRPPVQPRIQGERTPEQRVEGIQAPAPQRPTPPPVQRESERPSEREQLLAERRGGGGGERFLRGNQPPGIPEYPEEAKEPPRQRPSLESIPQPRETPPAQLRLPSYATPSRGTDELLREMARQRASGQGPGAGLGLPGADKGAGDPNFNLPGPQILSDTMGVDFDPYLLRVYLAVRRNWYAVIPEIARLGRKGRVVLQFHILRNGGVEALILEDGSGTTSMDTAAMSSIRLSNPFPPLPGDFPGADIRLRFVYFYNLRVE